MIVFLVIIASSGVDGFDKRKRDVMIQDSSQYFNEKQKFKGKTKDDEAIQIVRQYIFENSGNTNAKLRVTEVDTILGMTKYRIDLVPYDYTYYTLIYNSYAGIWTLEAFKRTDVKTYKTDNYHDSSGLSEYSVSKESFGGVL